MPVLRREPAEEGMLLIECLVDARRIQIALEGYWCRSKRNY